MCDTVFISHTTVDRDFVEAEIIPALNAMGLSWWYSREEIQSSHDFQQKIREALRRCEWFLVALTPRSVESDWVRAEVLLAIERLPKRIIPVLIESCDPSRCHIKLMLYQYVDWRSGSEQGSHQLGRAFQSPEEDRPPSKTVSEVPVVDQLRSIRESRDARQVGLVFRSLADNDEGVRIRARQALHAIGWKNVSQQVEKFAHQGNQGDIDDVLVGLAALESHADVVALLDCLVNLLTHETRNRAILLWERKSLALRLEQVSQILQARHSPLILEKVLGQGLTTATFLAKNANTGLPVVVRMLRPELASVPDLRMEFLKVVKRTCQYVHENLVMTRDGGQYPMENFYYCVRDYVPGATLQDVMDQNEALSPERILEIVSCIAMALRPIHQAGECHRGIKPSNVFLSTGDRVILGDAGLPISLMGMNMNRLAYDFRYAAPESFQSRQVVGPRSDFYSLGCLFYELVSGQSPFVSDSPFELASAHRTESIVPPSSLGNSSEKWADDFAMWLLARNPDERPADLARLLSAISDLKSRIATDAAQKNQDAETETGLAWEDYAPAYSIAEFHHPGDVFHSSENLPGQSPRKAAEPTPRVVAFITLDEFLHYLAESRLFTAFELSELRQQAARFNLRQDAKPFADYLIAENRLTIYQARAIYQRQPGRLVIGENYIVQDLVGSGGMGMVLKALHRRLNRVVALKILSRHARHDETAITRFSREINVAGRLNHPNVVRVHDAGEIDDIQYLVMEYIDGRDVGEIVRKNGPLTVEHAIGFTIQAATGLKYAHENHIIHRDIKPGNLLLDQNQVIKILDMGLAQIKSQLAEDEIQGLTIQGSILGTVDFMAPEQAADTTTADARSDIYSLGCTLYFLLTGQPVFPRPSAMATLIAHREDPVPLLSEMRKDIPMEVDPILKRMLAKQPAKRYQSMSEVIQALEQLP